MSEVEKRMGSDGALIRRLGSFERLFFNLDQNRPIHFAMGFDIAGAIERKALHDALRAVQARHPLLSCHIAIGQDGCPEFHRVSGADIEVRFAPASGPSTWAREAERELSRPFDPQHVPLLRVASIEGDGATMLVMAAHHAIADGRSILFVVRDLLAALDGRPLTPLAPLASREDLIDRLLHVEPEPLPQMSPREPHRYVPVGAAPQVSDLHLDADLTTAIHARAHRENTTVHGALCAALARATHARPNGWRESLFVDSPVDVRASLSVSDDCMFLLTQGLAGCRSSEVETFWPLARSMRDQTAQGAEPARIRAVAAGLAAFFSTNPDVASVAALAASTFGQAVVTNLGEVPFSDPRLRAVYGPALLMGFDGTPIIGATTTSGRLHLTLSGFVPDPDLLPAMALDLRTAVS